MASRIKGITVEIGGDTTGLDKALSSTNSKIRNTQTQLKDVERLLKLDPTNTELLRQKYQLLNTSVSETEKKLESLKSAEKQVQEQFQRGDIGEDQYNALKREIIETESKLGKLRSEAKNAANALDDVDEKPVEEVAKAADDAEDSLKDAGKEASNFGDYLKAGAIVEGAKGIVDSLKDVAEESKEYRKIMGSLEISSERAGYTAEQTSKIYKTLYGVLGDDQTAATATANLQALGLSQEQLIQMANGAIGAWSMYGDSIPIDGLAEALNETVKVGQVTGTFADVLNWAALEGETFGVKLKANTEANKEWNDAVAAAATAEDYFNLALQDAGSSAERANLVLQLLSEQGLTSAGQAWQDTNQSMVESNQATADLDAQIAQLGETVEPIFTTITQCVSDALAWFNSLDGDTQKLILTIGGLAVAIGVVGTVLNALLTTNPIILIITAVIAAIAAVIAYWDEIKAGIDVAIDWVSDALKSVGNFFIEIANGAISAVEWLINKILDGVNWGIQQINTMIGGVEDLLSYVGVEVDWQIPPISPVNLGRIPMLAEGGILSSGSAIVGEAGPELLTMMGNRAKVEPLTNHTSNTTNMGGVNIVVYGAPGQDVNELADIVMDRMDTVYGMKGAVFA